MEQNDKYQDQLDALIVELDTLIQTMGISSVSENEFMRRTYLERINEVQKKIEDTKLKRRWDIRFRNNNSPEAL